jgi:hypothetical protein
VSGGRLVRKEGFIAQTHPISSSFLTGWHICATRSNPGQTQPFAYPGHLIKSLGDSKGGGGEFIIDRTWCGIPDLPQLQARRRQPGKPIHTA